MDLPANFTANDRASLDLEGCVSVASSTLEVELFFRILSIENGMVSMDRTVLLAYSANNESFFVNKSEI